MKMADGGFRPAFNVQFAADTKSGAISGVSVDNNGSDMGKLAPISDALAKQYGKRAGQHLADGGFAKLDDIDTLTDKDVAVFMPVPKPRDAGRDRHVPLRNDTPAVGAWRQRMGEDAAKELYKERAATVELANAQARTRGLTQFVVRGVPKGHGGRVVVCFGAQHDVRLAPTRSMKRPRRRDASTAHPQRATAAAGTPDCLLQDALPSISRHTAPTRASATCVGRSISLSRAPDAILFEPLSGVRPCGWLSRTLILVANPVRFLR